MTHPASETPAPAQLTLSALALRALRIGLLSFGGPAAQIALLHREFVTEARAISEERFLGALNFCMILPGPEAQQLATYCGWLTGGLRGGQVRFGSTIQHDSKRSQENVDEV